MPLTVLKPTISAGQSLSNAVTSPGGTAACIVMPAKWTPANISFQVSADGVTFADVFDAGRELIVPCVPGTAVSLSDAITTKSVQLKIRSGARSSPVVQQADR